MWGFFLELDAANLVGMDFFNTCNNNVDGKNKFL